MAESLFFAGRLGVEVDHRRIADEAERAGGEFLFDAREGSSSASMKMRPIMLTTSTLAPLGRLDQIGAAPGVPGGNWAAG